MSAHAGSHGAIERSFLCYFKSGIASMRRGQIRQDLRLRVFSGFHCRFGFSFRKLLSSVVGLLDLLIARIRLCFPPVGLSHDKESGGMVRVTFLKLESRSPGVVQTQMVGSIHCRADQSVSDRIIV